ncbi:MAG: hypothetical protein JWR75_778 [Devosia sp.]|nr:hypothetical protein [Devosia sp.]
MRAGTDHPCVECLAGLEGEEVDRPRHADRWQGRNQLFERTHSDLSMVGIMPKEALRKVNGA